MLFLDIILLLLLTLSLQILLVRGRRILVLFIKSVIPVIGWRKTMATNCQVTVSTGCVNKTGADNVQPNVLATKESPEETTTATATTPSPSTTPVNDKETKCSAIDTKDNDTKQIDDNNEIINEKTNIIKETIIISNSKSTNSNSNSSSGVSSDDDENALVAKNNRYNKPIVVTATKVVESSNKPTRTKSPKKGNNSGLNGKRRNNNHHHHHSAPTSPVKAQNAEKKADSKPASPVTTPAQPEPKTKSPTSSPAKKAGIKSPVRTESGYATTVNSPTSTGPGGTAPTATTTFYNSNLTTAVDPEPVAEVNPVVPAIYFGNNTDAKPVDSTTCESAQRHAVLSYEQVQRLDDVMNEVVSIHGRGNYPTLEVRLRDLVTVVRDKLQVDVSLGGAGMRVNDIRLNGGCASHVLATECQPYNDLDLIFAVELANSRNYDKVKAAVLGSLFDLLPEGVSRKRITPCSLKEAYVSKMVKVSNDGDRWSLISLGNSRGHRNVELKFVDTMRRQFEFSVDSFQIVLDSLLVFYECQGNLQRIGAETIYPTIVGESVYGDFHEAIYHLQKKLISTRHPEEIRGGGLLKYCNLLVKNYKPAQPDYIKTLERYMCSRFFIDFPDIGQQKAKLENYLWNHFVGPEEEILKYQYLMLLHGVVEESTVCLMGHERRQTLALIENLAYQVFCQEQQQRSLASHHQHQHQVSAAPPPPTCSPAQYVYANGYYYAPAAAVMAAPGPACYQCSCNPSWMACSS